MMVKIRKILDKEREDNADNPHKLLLCKDDKEDMKIIDIR